MFIVACNSDLNVGCSDVTLDVDVIGFYDGFCFVERSFVGVCLMCPFEVMGEGLRCFCTAWYVMYGHVAKAPLSMAASHLDLTGEKQAPCRYWMMLEMPVIRKTLYSE